jgi:hypothetical protein
MNDSKVYDTAPKSAGDNDAAKVTVPSEQYPPILDCSLQDGEIGRLR